MWQALVPRAQPVVEDARQVGQGTRPAGEFGPLERVLLRAGVGQTLFQGFADHLGSERGDEETGWLLLGVREPRQATVLAALPAGEKCEASRAHVRFNSTAQAVGSRILRQRDRRLSIVGVVHTHPGSLRRPSKGDLRGDREWVARLRGGEGVFAIGTVESGGTSEQGVSQPHTHAQCLDRLRFTWYSLRQGERRYRALPVESVPGPDLARELQHVWPTVEEHADALEALLRQHATLRIDIVAEGLVLALGPLRVVLRGLECRYYAERGDAMVECHPGDCGVDLGVTQLLAELSGGETVVLLTRPKEKENDHGVPPPQRQ